MRRSRSRRATRAIESTRPRQRRSRMRRPPAPTGARNVGSLDTDDRQLGDIAPAVNGRARGPADPNRHNRDVDRRRPIDTDVGRRSRKRARARSRRRRIDREIRSIGIPAGISPHFSDFRAVISPKPLGSSRRTDTARRARRATWALWNLICPFGKRNGIRGAVAR